MITVVIPAYNAASFLPSAIKSILNQTYRDFELIIVDDGSTDNTKEIVKQYIELDKRVRLVENDHGGICQALNAGIKEAKYSWIARMDADDIALPERFEKQINAALANPNVVAWGTYAHHLSSTGQVLSLIKQGALSEQEFYKLRQEGHIPLVIHPTALLNKNVLLEVGGYDPKYQLVEDLELFDRMANYGAILAIPEPLLLYRIHSKSESMQKFFRQKQLARYVVARHRSQLSGQKEPELNQFIFDYQNQPIFPRVKQQVNTLGQFWYRKAGLFFAEKQYLQAGLYLSIAIASNPSYTIPRVWKQKLSPKTRQLLGEAKKTG